MEWLWKLMTCGCASGRRDDNQHKKDRLPHPPAGRQLDIADGATEPTGQETTPRWMIYRHYQTTTPTRFDHETLKTNNNEMMTGMVRMQDNMQYQTENGLREQRTTTGAGVVDSINHIYFPRDAVQTQQHGYGVVPRTVRVAPETRCNIPVRQRPPASEQTVGDRGQCATKLVGHATWNVNGMLSNNSCQKQDLSRYPRHDNNIATAHWPHGDNARSQRNGSQRRNEFSANTRHAESATTLYESAERIERRLASERHSSYNSCAVPFHSKPKCYNLADVSASRRDPSGFRKTDVTDYAPHCTAAEWPSTRYPNPESFGNGWATTASQNPTRVLTQVQKETSFITRINVAPASEAIQDWGSTSYQNQSNVTVRTPITHDRPIPQQRYVINLQASGLHRNTPIPRYANSMQAHPPVVIQTQFAPVIRHQSQFGVAQVVDGRLPVEQRLAMGHRSNNRSVFREPRREMGSMQTASDYDNLPNVEPLSQTATATKGSLADRSSPRCRHNLEVYGEREQHPPVKLDYVVPRTGAGSNVELGTLGNTNESSMAPVIADGQTAGRQHHERSKSSTGGQGPRKPRGLVNMGSTCYFNSVLQNINQTFVLEELLKSQIPSNASKQPITVAVREFYKQMGRRDTHNVKKWIDATKSGCDRNAFEPRLLFENIGNRSTRFANNRQQDSHELLRHMMDGVKEEEKECNSYKKDAEGQYRHLTVVDRVFGGHCLTVFKCNECDMPYHLFEPFLDISLPIAFSEDNTDQKTGTDKQPLDTSGSADDSATQTFGSKRKQNDNGKQPKLLTRDGDVYKKAVEATQQRLAKLRANIQQNSLLDCLRVYTRKEQLNEYICLNCAQGEADFKLKSGSKETIIYNPPAILTLHLKRFEQTHRGYVKVSRHVSFDTALDLSPYCSLFAKRRREFPEIKYKLYGIAVHGGSLESGHYTACIRLRAVDVEKTKAFLQKEFLDREALVDKQKLVQLVEATRRRPEYLCASPIEDDVGVWYELSDDWISRISEQDVLRKQAYLLFYERIF